MCIYARGRSGQTDGGIDMRLMDQYLSLFTGRAASGSADGKFDAVGALMLDSPGALLRGAADKVARRL